MKPVLPVRNIQLPAKLILMTFLLGTSLALRSDVVLVPGTIAGNVRIGDEVITFLRMQAFNADDSALQTLSPNVVTAAYSLTVNVPQGTTPTYDTRVQFAYTTDPEHPQNTDYFIFPFVEVTAVESETQTVDFILDQPGYINGNVVLNGDGEIDYYYIYANPTVINGYSHYTLQRADDSDRNTVPFAFPVSPGELRCSGFLYLTSGARINLPNQVVTVAAGESQSCNYEVDTPEIGSVGGEIEFSGEVAPNRFYVYTNSPTRRTWIVDDPNNPESYSLPELSLGTYYMYAWAYLNDNDDQFSFPDPAFSPSRRPVIEAGDLDTVDISACQTYLNGDFIVRGSASPDDLSTSTLRFFGAAPETQSGQGIERLLTGDTSYDAILSTGAWRSNYFDLRLIRPDSHEDGYLNTRLYLYDASVMPQENPVTFAQCGATENRNFDYRFGSVTVNFTIAGGGTMSQPRLLGGTCTEAEEDGTPLYSYFLQQAFSNQVDVEVGSVAMLAPQGLCEGVEAFALVDGSLTSFGTFNLEVVGGSDVIIDIGGPQVAVTSPESEACLAGDEVTVTGTATDDVGVVSVTVNGEIATLDPAGGEGTLSTDFSATIPLDPGPNEIETIATDTSDKTGSDTRTVYNDGGPPVLDWTPADGASTSESSIEVAGTVSDDVDVASVTVNGDPVVLVPTGNPGEYSFSTVVELEDGENMITVVATDTSNCGDPTTQVRTVTLSDNTGPMVDEVRLPAEPAAVGAAAEAECLFSDPDSGDSHHAEWDWGDGTTSAGIVDGYTATGSHQYAAAGAYTVSCTITDAAGESDTGSAAQPLLVYDPSGHLTGGGWFRSPEDAYPQDMRLEGRKINFGMVSKYQRGNGQLTGNIQFNGRVFNFHSTALHWMIIDGNWAQVAGTGTVDRQGEYAFLFTVIDSGKSREPDAVRMKIWDPADPGNPLYDNQPGEPDDSNQLTDLGGGNLVIHTRRR
ncbi:hypothetical protein E2F43_03070 [Seongchinamella unica]|uniref:PKD domain-containing protein n=1 Tax=Seongchinamella unica TaxID=2547392 RepID=A0A4R5LV07_9GAMM|nr:PKD domain-containing protein [Seongchinamella unica]TDG15230.1 hypothetical protein E2F43_03070 [Seongchinamella unica]